MMPASRKTSLASGTLAILIGIVMGVILIEGLSRFLDEGPKGADSLDLTLQPYMMFTVSGNARNPIWRNVETGTDVPSRMTFNNLGFAEREDFTFPPDAAYAARFGRKPPEKLVVITGGSVVHGVGATANELTIASQMEKALNERQSRQRYRVVNLGMGSWIAYQQFVGLSLFGLPLQPDWIVAMDGHNDGAVPCAQGAGAGNPMEWPKILYYASGGQGGSSRGEVAQWLVDHSAAMRLVSGPARIAPNNQLGLVQADPNDPDARFRLKLRGLTMSVLDRQVDFYVQAQRGMLDLFKPANVLLSSQPLLHDNAVTPLLRPAFDFANSPAEAAAARGRLSADLDAYMAKAGNTPCDSRVGPQALGYFMARSALRLERAVADWATETPGRSVAYANVEMLFPRETPRRLPNFIDNAHMTDLGQRRVGEFFASHILQVDLGLPFDPRAMAGAIAAQ